GLELGGHVTAEVLMSSVSESLRFVAIIACFFAFIASTSSVDLLRSLPGYLFQAGLALNLALVFAPSLIKTAMGIRDFQRVRHRRARSPIWIVPLLATALERSIAVAESMDSRGFGRRTEAPPAWARGMAAGGGLLLATGGGAFAAGSRSLMAWGVMVAGAALLAAGLIGLGRSCRRTRLRSDPLQMHDLAVLFAIGGMTLWAVVVAAGGTSLHFDPYAATDTLFPSTTQVIQMLAIATPAFVYLRQRDRALR
ncbi:MAG TPA: energy-coupling factor transporter transmembrane component T, partial [Actinomycetota bacterium]|nr:energy-coupling factor transporter transmembrane component T [Actinomycetota bacterium]